MCCVPCSCLVTCTHAQAPPGLETSAQGLSNMIRNLGTITGTMVAGYIMDSRGSIFLYRAAAGLVALTWSIYLMVTLRSHSADSMQKATVE